MISFIIPFKIYGFHDFRDRGQFRIWAGGVFLKEFVYNSFSNIRISCLSRPGAVSYLGWGCFLNRVPILFFLKYTDFMISETGGGFVSGLGMLF